jgi:hypothetical protein
LHLFKHNQGGSYTCRVASGLRSEDQDRGIRTEAKKAGAGCDKQPVKFGHEQ